MQNKKVRLGMIMPVADLYCRHKPELPEELYEHWHKTLSHHLGDVYDLFFTGYVSSASGVAAQVHECEQQDCDVLIVLLLAYASSEYCVASLARTKLPVLIVSSCRDATLPYDMDMGYLAANQAVHGIQELTNTMWRNGLKFSFLSGHPSDIRFQEKLYKLVTVASAARMLSSSNVGRIGEPLEGMLDFRYEDDTLAKKLGMNVIPIEPDALVTRSDQVSSKDIEAFLNWARESFVVDDDITEEELSANAAISLALESIVGELSLSAVAMNFLPVTEAGAEAMPFLGASRLMSRGVGYAGEGDVLTAALNAVLSRISGLATFTEMFCPDYQRNEILLSHIGECNYMMANSNMPVRLRAKEFSWGNCQRLVIPVFQLQPGSATIVSITETPAVGDAKEKTFCLVAADGEIVEAPEHPNLRSPYTRMSFGPDLSDFLEQYSRAGGTHHLVLCQGNLLEEMATLARYCQINSSTIRST